MLYHYTEVDELRVAKYTFLERYQFNTVTFYWILGVRGKIGHFASQLDILVHINTNIWCHNTGRIQHPSQSCSSQKVREKKKKKIAWKDQRLQLENRTKQRLSHIESLYPEHKSHNDTNSKRMRVRYLCTIARKMSNCSPVSTLAVVSRCFFFRLKYHQHNWKNAMAYLLETVTG